MTRRYIPKADGKQRPLGIPTVRDRVAQMAAKLVIEPIFEADFLPVSYGFRPKKSATQALEAIREAGNRGNSFVLDADIRSYFDSIDQGKLLGMVSERISDRLVVKLIRKWLLAGVMEDGTVKETLAGTPQGGVISPLVANIFLHELDRTWERECRRLDLRFMQRWPSPKAMKRVRERIHGLTNARRSGAKDVKEIIAALNPVLRGWGNYLRTGTSNREFNRIDDYVYRRLIRWMWRRGGQRARHRGDAWPQQRLHEEMGLHRLRDTVRYPAQATPRRPSVSRVRETRTHGLKGGSGNGLA